MTEQVRTCGSLLWIGAIVPTTSALARGGDLAVPAGLGIPLPRVVAGMVYADFAGGGVGEDGNEVLGAEPVYRCGRQPS